MAGFKQNGNSAVLEKEHPKGPLGTIKGHKTTKKQQRFFGIARGMQKGDTAKSYSPAAAKLAGGLSGKEIHKIASKPKGGFRRKSDKSETALKRVMQMVAELEVENQRIAEQEVSPATTNQMQYRNIPPNLPVHASEDAKEFQMMSARLDNLEKRLRQLEQPGPSTGAAPNPSVGAAPSPSAGGISGSGLGTV